MRSASSARRGGAAERIVRDTARASAVITRVRSLFSKSDYVREITDINQMLENMAEILREEADRRGLGVELKLARGLPMVRLDPVQIR